MAFLHTHADINSNPFWTYLSGALCLLIVILTPWQLYIMLHMSVLENELVSLNNLLTNKPTPLCDPTNNSHNSVDLSAVGGLAEATDDVFSHEERSEEGLEESLEEGLEEERSGVGLAEIVEGSVNVSSEVLQEVMGRWRRADRDGRNRRPQRIECTAPKMLSLELSVYARSVEVETTQKLDRWANMRGPPVDESVALDPRTHLVHNNHVTIKEPGLYLVYAQISFGAARRAHRIGFAIQKKRNHVDEQIAKCIDQEHGLDEEGQPSSPHAARQCYTSTVLPLELNDELSVATLYPDQSIYPNRDMTFFGLLKLACMN